MNRPGPISSLIVMVLMASIGADGLIAQQQTSRISSTPAASFASDQSGRSADELVAIALEQNDELNAMRRELDAAEAMITQARLRANPTVEAAISKNPATTSKALMLNGSLPLELFGRRPARVRVAEQELAIKRQAVADRERSLAAEVRSKFGETLAMWLKLGFVDETLARATENYQLVTARVDEGSTAPLERNMVAVELNRIRAMRERADGAVRISLLELKNMIGMKPDEILNLLGDFQDLIDPLPPEQIAVQQAVADRPDLQMSREVETLAQARIDQAKAEGRLDASLTAGVQRMRQGFPQQGFNDLGQLEPIGEVANVFTVGVMLEVPLFNRNQGKVEAAAFEKTAAQDRTAFGELTVRREVAAAYTRYRSAARAMEIYREGVVKQAAANLEVVRQTYELGATTLLDYIAEQRRYIEIKDGFIDAQRDTYLARVEVLRAANSPELIKK